VIFYRVQYSFTGNSVENRTQKLQNKRPYISAYMQCNIPYVRAGEKGRPADLRCAKFRRNRNVGKPYFKFPTTVFFLLYVSTLNTVCIGLFCILTNKSSLRCSVLHSRRNWTVLLRLFNVTLHATIILGVNHAAGVSMSCSVGSSYTRTSSSI